MPNAKLNLKRLEKMAAAKSIKTEWNKLKENGLVKKEWAKVKDNESEVLQLLANVLSDKADERKSVKDLMPNYCKPDIKKPQDFKEAIETHARHLAGLDELEETFEQDAPDDQAKKLKDTLGKLKPLLSKAIQSSPDQKDSILKMVATIQNDIGGGNLDNATRLIKELHAKISGTSEAPVDDQQSDEDESQIPGWSRAKKTWQSSKKNQVSAIKDVMNELGNIALDSDMPADAVNAVISELSDYVPDFKSCVQNIDAAIAEIDNAANPDARKKAADQLRQAKAEMVGFCTGPRIKKYLVEFEGENFFNPTLDAISLLTL